MGKHPTDANGDRQAHTPFRINALTLAGQTGVPPEALPPLRPRERVVPDTPPADVVAAVTAQTGLSPEQVVKWWKQATSARFSRASDPYQRWLTHRYAAAQLANHLSRPLPLAELAFPEVSGYAALLWPLTHQALQQAHPITRFLSACPDEPSHMSWSPGTAYVGICIALYAAAHNHWLIVLNAELENPPQAWVTVQRTEARTVHQAAWEVLRTYETALDEVDIPAYQQESRICGRCHAWCGWQGQCQQCTPSVPEQPASRWSLLAEAYSSPPAYEERSEGAYLYGHPLLESALVVLKAQWGFVPVAEAVDFVRQLEASTLPHLLRQAGFSFATARRVVQEVQQGEPLAGALRKVLTRPAC